MEIADKLQTLANEVDLKLPAARRSEANTSQFLVMPFFEALGYSVLNPNDVEPEFMADVGIQRERVDYALKVDGKPAILVEVKYAGASLDNQHAAQLRRYFSTKLDIRFGILTNGTAFRFFSDLDRPNVMDDEPFLTLDLLDLDENSVGILKLFTKSGFQKLEAVAAARNSKDRQRIRQALQAEFDPLSANAAGYILDIVASGESDESRRGELMSLLRQEWLAFLRSLPTPPVSPSPTPDPPQSDPVEPVAEKAWVDIPVLDGSVEIPIYATWQGHQFTATLSLWGKIANVGKIVLWEGEWLTPSQAGKQARQTVEPNATGHINGMTFWHLRDPADQQLRPINDFHYYEDLLPRVLNHAAE